MFVDQVQVEVQAGKGGDGMVAFRRQPVVTAAAVAALFYMLMKAYEP